MKILIDICHPSDVHLFRYFYQEMINRNHQILFTVREKDVTINLLKALNIEYKQYGKSYNSKIGKILGIIKNDFQIFLLALNFKPDLFLSHGSFYSSHVAFLLRKPYITFEDTGNMEQINLYKHFSNVILTPNSFDKYLGKNQIKFNGYKELAYLHPNNFIPDKTILNELGVLNGEKYIIFRFCSWNASHDIGHKGISYENKIHAINEFSKFAKVFISSESELPEELKKYQIKIAPHRMHDALAFASFHLAESFTMPSECSVLGTPSIIIHNTTSFYLKEQQEKFSLCFCYSESEEDQQKAINKGLELLQIEELKDEWKNRRDKMLSEKIDVSAFLVWFVENYPDSDRVMRENPEFQDGFK